MDYFFALLSPNNPKNQNFDKMKKTPGDIIILHKCTINGNHMMYGLRDIKCDRQNCLSFWTDFCPFTPPNNLKNQNFEKLKNIPGDIISFYTSAPKIMIMCYTVLDMACDRCNCYFLFWAIFFALLPPPPPWTAQKIKILKKWKTHLEILSFYICVPKIMENYSYNLSLHISPYHRI